MPYIVCSNPCLIPRQGGHAGWTGGPTNDGPGDSYMLQVRGTSVLNTKAIQVHSRSDVTFCSILHIIVYYNRIGRLNVNVMMP